MRWIDYEIENVNRPGTSGHKVTDWLCLSGLKNYFIRPPVTSEWSQVRDLRRERRWKSFYGLRSQRRLIRGYYQERKRQERRETLKIAALILLVTGVLWGLFSFALWRTK